MTLYTSGLNDGCIDVTHRVFSFFTKKHFPITNHDVEVHYCDLSDDNVKGYQEQNGDEFLIHIDTHLGEGELIKTIFHELVHCAQDIRGLTNNEEREDEAYTLEEKYAHEFLEGGTVKLSL